MYKEINITIYKGDTFKLPVKVKINKISTFKVWFSCSSAPEPHSYIFQKAITFTHNSDTSDFVEYELPIVLDPIDTRNVNPGDYYYDIRMVSPSEAFTLVYGTLTVKSEVTK